MKVLITAILLLISTLTYSQHIEEYEDKLATYIYLAIDPEGMMDCIDTSKNSHYIEFTDVSDEYLVIELSEFTIDRFYKETITEDLLRRIYYKIYENYERRFLRRGKEFTRSSYEMTVYLLLHQDLEDPEMIFGRSYITFKIYFQ